MDRKYRVKRSQSQQQIVPAFIATKVAAENRGWNTSLIVQTIITMVTIIGTVIMAIIHGPKKVAMDIQIGTIIMAITYGYPSWNN